MYEDRPRCSIEEPAEREIGRNDDDAQFAKTVSAMDRAIAFILHPAGHDRDIVEFVLRKQGFVVQSYDGGEGLLARLTTQADGVELNGCVLADGAVASRGSAHLIDALAHSGLRLPVIMITPAGDVESAVQAMKAGAVDVVQRPFRAATLVRKVLAAFDEARRLPCAQRATEATACGGAVTPLTPREREVMRLVVEGLSNKLIGQRLGIAHRTVEVHRANVMRKMRARSSAELIRKVLAASAPSEPTYRTRIEAEASGEVIKMRRFS